MSDLSDRETWMASAIIELAGGQPGYFDESLYAAALAARLTELLHPAEAVVTLCPSPGISPVVAGNDDRTASLVPLAADEATGPAAECCRTGSAVRLALLDVTAAAPWPRFAAEARAAGFGSATALPLRYYDETVGAVTVLVPRDHELDQASIRLTALLVEAAAIAVLQQRSLTRSLNATRQLQHALDSRVAIEQAKGATAAWLDISPGEAFELLRGYARRHGRLLSEVSGEVVRGVIPTQDLAGPGKPARRGATGGRSGR
jgi:transcriptional regulator with GAF, ATPase, and Fis domain